MAKKVFTHEFRQAAVHMVVTEQHTIVSVAKRLDVNYHTLREWIQAARSGSATTLIRPEIPLDQRVGELEKENARLRSERDILKKATAYFAKEHL